MTDSVSFFPGDNTSNNAIYTGSISPLSAGTYNALVINASGQIVGGSLAAATSITATGDVTGSGNSTINLTLASVGSAGTYSKIITDAKGRVIYGSSLALSDVETALGYAPAPISSPVLTGLAQSTGAVLLSDNSQIIATTSFVKGQQYITGNQQITVSGDVSGSGTTAISLSLMPSGVTPGTYNGKVIVNSKGLITSAYLLSLSDVTGALGFTPVSTTLIGANNGIATLNANGQLTDSQIPASLIGGLNYQGVWNAATNTPTLTSSVGTKGYYYQVSVAGTTSLNGISSWNVGDQAIYNGTAWSKIDGVVSEVLSVAGRTGVITLSVSDVSGAAPLASPAFTGTPTSQGALSLSDASQSLATTSFVKGQAYITGNQTITVSGDVSGSGTTAISLSLAPSGVTPGTYNGKVIVNAKGLIIGASELASSDVTGALGYVPPMPVTSTAGTYNQISLNNAGQVTGGSLVPYLTGITEGQVIAALGFTPSTPIVSTAGTYNNLTINSAGQVISGSNVSYLTGITEGQVIAALGFTPSTPVISSAGTYNQISLNSAGQVTGGSLVPYLTGITSSQVTTALGYVPPTPVTSTSGTYNNLIINSAGQVTGGSNISYLTGINSSEVTAALGYTPFSNAGGTVTGSVSVTGTLTTTNVSSTGTLTGNYISASECYAPFFLGPTVISADYTVPDNMNAMTIGPTTIADGVTITIPSGSNWSIR